MPTGHPSIPGYIRWTELFQLSGSEPSNGFLGRLPERINLCFLARVEIDKIKCGWDRPALFRVDTTSGGCRTGWAIVPPAVGGIEGQLEQADAGVFKLADTRRRKQGAVADKRDMAQPAAAPPPRPARGGHQHFEIVAKAWFAAGKGKLTTTGFQNRFFNKRNGAPGWQFVRAIAFVSIFPHVIAMGAAEIAAWSNLIEHGIVGPAPAPPGLRQNVAKQTVLRPEHHAILHSPFLKTSAWAAMNMISCGGQRKQL